MQIIDYIKRLNTKILFKYLLDSEGQCHFSEALYLDIYERLTSNDSIQERFEELEKDDQEALLSVYFSGEKGIRFEESPSKARLLKSFFVYEKSIDDEFYLCGFTEYKEVLSQKVTSKLRQPADTDLIALPFKKAFISDLAIILNTIDSSSTILKQTGFVTKQFLDDVLRVTYMGRMVEAFSLSDADKELLFDTLFSLCQEMGALLKDGSRIALSEHLDDDLSRIFMAFEDSVEKSLNSKGLDSAFLKLLSQREELYFDKAFFTQSLLIQLLILCWMGTVDVELGESGLRIVENSSPEIATFYPSGHMMPDFSVMIPREIEPLSLYEFLKIGTIESFDMIYHGKINREKIVNSVAGAMQEESVLSILTKWNGAPNLFSTINDWMHGFNKLFIDGSYLAIKESDADAIVALPEISSLIQEISGYRFFKIANGKEKLIDSVLKSKNFDTRYAEKEKASIHLEDTMCVSIPHEHDYTEVNYDPQMEVLSTPKTQMGIYSSQLKKVSVGDMGKLVKYASLMDYKLIIEYRDEFNHLQNIVITPINLAGGKDSFIEASDSVGSVKKFMLERIEKMGVLSDDC